MVFIEYHTLTEIYVVKNGAQPNSGLVVIPLF